MISLDCEDCLNHHTSLQRGNIPCAARCMAEDNCDAFYYESSVCHHSRSGGLRGAEQAPSSSRAVFMDASKPIGNSWSQIMLDLIVFFAVDCIWAAWSVWGTCDPGTGIQDRSRTKDPEGLNGGTECAGDATEQQNCPGRDLQGRTKPWVQFCVTQFCQVPQVR